MSDMPRETITTPYGTFVVDMLRDKKMGTKLKSIPYPQEETIQVLKEITTQDSIVVDVGSHIGTLAIPLANLVKKVIAFEMDPETFASLQKNIQLNNVVIDTRNIALGETKGFGATQSSQLSNAGANTFMVGSGNLPISTLSDEVDAADVIKIDVEGMELKVLMGASTLIKRSRPAIVFEINLPAMHAHEVKIGDLSKFFRTLDYRVYVFHKGEFKEVFIWLAALMLAFRGVVFHKDAGPFDLIALPKEKVLPLKKSPFSGIPALWNLRRSRKV